MNVFQRFWSLFKQKPARNEGMPTFSAEALEALAAAEDETFFRDSKLWLQRFDEYITAAEIEIESVSIELDGLLNLQDSVSAQLKTLNKSGSWHEKSLLIKLDRLNLHADNLKKRIEIYSQNIRVYLNLMSKIQDIQAMKMNGLDEDKISNIWVQFKECLDQYKDRLLAEEAGYHDASVTTEFLEKQLNDLKNKVIAPVTVEKEESQKPQPVEENKGLRPPIKDLLDNWEPEPSIQTVEKE